MKYLLILLVLSLAGCATGKSLGNGQVSVYHGALTSTDDIFAAARKACGTNRVSFVGKSDSQHTVFNCY